MISDPQQEQATLYALGLLDADEATAFERELAADASLRTLVRELRETAALLAEVTDEPYVSPPAELRNRVLQQIGQETRTNGSVAPRAGLPVASGKIVQARFAWVPWAVAALLLGCSTFLAWDRSTMTRQLADARRPVAVPPAPAPPDAFSQVAFCELEPTPDAPVRPRAAVLWDAAKRKGRLRVSELAPPASGKDYQLWAVKVGSKQPVNAGVVHLDAEGHADFSFEPDTIPGDNQVVALALSVEQAGGSPTNQGPILFLGKL